MLKETWLWRARTACLRSPRDARITLSPIWAKGYKWGPSKLWARLGRTLRSWRLRFESVYSGVIHASGSQLGGKTRSP